MTTNYLKFNPMNEDSDDASGQIAWPGTTTGPLGALSNLVISGGETIIKNKGFSTTYTSEDGTKTVQFSQYLVGTTITGAAGGASYAIDGSHTGYYDGPWGVVPANVIDWTEPAFQDVEIWGDVDWYGTLNPVANTTTFPVYARSGPQIATDQTIADYAITQNHIGPSMVEYGHLAGATGLVPNAPHSPFFFGTNSANDVFDFKTKDGSGGDAANITSWAGPKGGSFLINTSAIVNFVGGVGYPVGPVIYDTDSTSGLTPPMATWPYSGTPAAPVPGSAAHPGSPADSIITFCTYFPGGPGTSSFVSGSLANSDYTLAFSFYKSVVVPGTYAGTSGTYTQTIETPLSSPLAVHTAAGQGVQFTIPPVPTGWTGVRIYAKNVTWSAGGTFFLQTLTTNYTLVSNTVTFTSFANTGVRTASHGFAAWPAGTNLLDPSAVKIPLMPIGHMPHTVTKRGTWPFMPYNSALDTQEQHSIGTGVILTDHLDTSNTYSSGNVLGEDANGNLSWVGAAGSSLSSLSNGPYTFSLDSAGHLHALGSGPPTYYTNGNLSTSTFTVAGTDNFFHFQLVTPAGFATNGPYTVILHLAQNYLLGTKIYAVISAANTVTIPIPATVVVSAVATTNVIIQFGSSGSVGLTGGTSYQWNVFLMAVT